MIRALLRDSLVYGLATILSRGLAILTVPLYTRMLSAGDYGVLDLILTLGVLANLVVPLEVTQAMARFWGESPPGEPRRRLAGTTLWFSAGMYVLFVAGGLALAPQLNAMLQFAPEHVPALGAGFVLVACNGIFFTLQNQFRFELRSLDFAVASVVYALLQVTLGVALGYRFGLPGILVGQGLAALLAAAWAGWRLRDSIRAVVDVRQLRMLLLFSWPLVLSGVATYLSLHANRLVLNSMTTLEDVGLYAVGYRIASLVALIIVGVQGALTPLVYAHHQEPETPGRLAVIFSGFVAVALLACLGAALFAPELVSLFAPPAFAPAASLVAPLAPAILMSQMYIFAPGIALGKKTQWQLLVFVASALACVALSYGLIPRLGVAGAAWAALASAAVFLVLWFSVSQRWYAVPFDWPRIGLGVAAFVLCLWLSQWLDHGPWGWLLLGRAALLLLLAILVVAAGLVDRRQLMGFIARRGTVA